MIRNPKSRVHAIAVLLTGLVLAAGLSPAAALEVCWVADAAGELSFVRAQITPGGDGHFLFHGHAFRMPDGGPQPFDGNAERIGGSVIGVLTKLELNVKDLETWIEAYHGLFALDLATKNGTVEGILTECLTPPTEPPTCNVLNTGPIPLWHDSDCDPLTLPPEL